MKFDVLYNFISPVTGRVLCDPDYVLMGDSRGIAIPSPILSNIIDASFVIGFPNASLPNAQVLNSFADGYVYNSAGIISTTPTVIPFLTEKKLWIGDATNTPTEYSTIFLENLHPLGLTIFPDPLSPDGFVGEYYEGTSSGVPEVSSRIGLMFVDLAYATIRVTALATVQFIIADANIINRTLFKSSQFLADLAPGGIAKVEATGQISIAIAGTDYLNVTDPGPDPGFIPTISPGPYPANPKIIGPSTITIINGNDIQDVNSLAAIIVSAKNAVTSDDIMVSKNNVQTQQLLLADPTSAFTKFAILKGPNFLFNDLEWIMPDQQGLAGQVLTNTDGTQLQWNDPANGNVLGPEPAVSTDGGLAVWDGITGRKIKDCTITIIGGDSISNVNSISAEGLIETNGNIYAKNTITSRTVVFLDSIGNKSASLALPDIPLISNIEWFLPVTPGTATQVLTNLDGNQLGWTTPANPDAFYIVQTSDPSLPNAQALADLEGDAPRILKMTAKGEIELAVEGTDYGNVSGPESKISITDYIAVWEDEDGRKIKVGSMSIEEIETEIGEALEVAEAAEATADAAEATAIAAEATADAALEQAEQALLIATGAAGTSILGSLFGGSSRRGPAGSPGAPGVVGAPGAAGAAGKTTLVIDSNISVLGGRVQDIAASPEADFDAVSAKWVWDLLNDNVEIKWE